MTNKHYDKIIGYVIGIFLIIISLYIHISNNDENYIILKKKIIKIHSRDGKTCDKSTHIFASQHGINVSNNYNCIIYVKHNGLEYPFEINNSSTSYILGQEIEVYYDKNDKSDILKLYQKNYWHYFLFIIGLIILFITRYGTNISNDVINQPIYSTSSLFYSDNPSIIYSY